MQTPRIDRHPLQQESASPAYRIPAVLRQLFQKFLMAKKRVGWALCFEVSLQ
jgi:hypothetical protein